jgi:hypothetical protein
MYTLTDNLKHSNPGRILIGLTSSRLRGDRLQAKFADDSARLMADVWNEEK